MQSTNIVPDPTAKLATDNVVVKGVIAFLNTLSFRERQAIERLMYGEIDEPGAGAMKVIKKIRKELGFTD